MKPATKLIAITPALHGWAAYHSEWKVFLNSYALQTPDGVVLIDPTQPTPAALRQLEALGAPVAILLTNAHHDRAADWFRKHYEVQIYAHEAAPADCETKIDVPVVDGERLPGGLKAIFLPGVSPSELALFSKANAGVLMIGDAILHTPGKGLELLPDRFIADKKQAQQSLQKLLDYTFEVVTFGHGEPVVTCGKKAIASFLKPHRPIRSSSGNAR